VFIAPVDDSPPAHERRSGARSRRPVGSVVELDMPTVAEHQQVCASSIGMTTKILS
jgi:hypothetical protein